MGPQSRPGGLSFPRFLAAFGVLAAVALTLLITRSEAPPSQGPNAGKVQLRADVEPRVGIEQGTAQATIRRDSHGIPHIEAPDYKGLGFGYGYAFAEDNICTIAESYVTVRAERSRYSGSGVEGTFGPDGDYPQRGNGFGANNLNSDFFYQRIIDKGIIEDLLDEPAPTGPAPEIFEGVRGYVAGYNKYLADTGVNNLPDPRCRGAEWVKPITEMDAYRRFYQLALLASQSVVIDGIAGEKTPGGATGSVIPQDLIDALEDLFPTGGLGSNAYGLGSDATTNGKGMVLGNPHFPWDGPERFYQTHLTIPGEINVSGASLFGVPLILIGHTDNLAWSHTVSTAWRFTPFQETINPANPTQYAYDGPGGPFRDMTEDEVTVMARNGMGNLEPRTRTIYSTHHGPIFNELSGIPLPWTSTTAFSMGDVNATNFRYLNHFFEVNRAQTVDELDEIEKDFQGIPWVNTIAADSNGDSYYADIGAIPNVSNTKATTCNSAVGVATYGALGLPVLNGHLASCEWDTDGDSVAPGILGYANLPKLKRDDYVTNSNDSYWLSNPAEPLTGYARIIGDEETERSLRTRLGLKIVEQRLDGTDGEGGTKFTRQKLQDAVFNNRQYFGELVRDDLVTLCETAPGGMLAGSSGDVDVSGACEPLDNWDLHDNLDSDGAILFRRFASRLLASIGGLVGDPTIFVNQFMASDPVDTPNTLNTAHPKVQQALADAVTDLQNASIPFNAPLLGYQFERRGAQEIPIHGGPGGLGVFNAIGVNWVGSGPDAGYPNVPHGSSFVMVTSFTTGCPDDRSILTYSQSANPDSPYWKDQTEMFSEKQWVNPPFCADEVAAAGLSETTISGCLPAGCGAGAGSGSGGSQQGAAQPAACSNLIAGTKGNNRLRGTDGPDRIRGRHGDDRIRGGGGEDCLHGGSGDDRISSRDGGPDQVRCGRGDDVVTKSDPADKLVGCEAVR